MKVCTDSCVFGAWTANYLEHSKHILDIGSGTGLLSLMLAQKSPAEIDGIEYDSESFSQSIENIQESPWATRIGIVQGDVRVYEFKQLYDFIITNPPFFENDLQSPAENINSARHGSSLNFEELISSIDRNLHQAGSFTVLLPSHRSGYFKNLAVKNGFYLKENISLRQTPRHEPFRNFHLYNRISVAEPYSAELFIKNEKNKYSEEFVSLLNSYYEQIAFDK
jgi:tRNA1Val (adenine37-N6)-methyltransferase